MILTVTLNPCLHKFVKFRGTLDERIVVRPVESSFQAGGKGINVARVVHRLGGDVTALTFVGGPVGEIFAESIRAEGIRLEAVPMRASTRMSTMVYAVDTGQFREFLEPGPEVDDKARTAFRSRFEQLAARADLVTLNGSVSDPRLDSFYAECVAHLRKLGKRAIVDTYGRAAPLAAAALPFMLKANVDEVRESFGIAVEDDTMVTQFADEWVGRGIEFVLITDGARQARVFSRQGVRVLRPPPITEVNAVGSGDAMLGALAFELARGSSVENALSAACAAGAANAERLGICDIERSRVAELAGRVTASTS